MGQMSKDRVRFLLGPRYFKKTTEASRFQRNKSSGFTVGEMVTVMADAFNVGGPEFHGLVQAHPDGFRIMCRPSQFARFIVYRHDLHSGINGIRDLEPELLPGCTNSLEPLAQASGLFIKDIACVVELLGLRANDAARMFDEANGRCNEFVLHVWDRPHTGGITQC